MSFFNLDRLRTLLPRCCPMLLLDAAEIIDDTHAAGVKAVTVNEEFFNGHFPGHPIMPGVLQIEMMKQLCELLARPCLDPQGIMDIHTPLIEKAKFRKPVTPGDRLKITAELLSVEGGRMRFRTYCSSSSGVCSEAFLTLAARPLAALEAMPGEDTACGKDASGILDTVPMMKMMPHRYPFLFIDYIASCDSASATAVKNLSGNDSFFRHFTAPSPMLPESLVCEMSAQAGAAAVLSRPENAGKIGVFIAIERAESFKPFLPGEQLVIKASLPGKGKFGKGPGTVTVAGEERFKLNIMFAIVDA